MKSILLSFLIFVSSFSCLFSQEIIDLPRLQNSSYEGRSFRVAFMQNELASDNESYLTLYVIARFNSTVTFRIPGEDPDEVEINAGQILRYDMPLRFEHLRSEVIENNKSIEINSSHPIIVYCFNSKIYSTDAYTAIPIENWGTDYYVASVGNDFYMPTQYDQTRQDTAIAARSRTGEFLVMAQEDGTEVRVRLTAPSYMGKPAYQEYTVRLQKGETYQVQAQPTDAVKGVNDLTGTRIKSNKPIGVLSGHQRTSVPQQRDVQYDSKDHIVDMLPPTQSWGTEHVTVPFGEPSYEVFKIISMHADTKFSVETADGIEDFVIDIEGGFLEFHRMDKVAFWKSDKPVMIAQIMYSQNYGNNREYHDPSLVIVPPMENMVNRSKFYAPNNVIEAQRNQFVNHGALIIADQDAVNSLTLDGIPIRQTNQFRAFGFFPRNLYWTRVYFPAGEHDLIATEGKFVAIQFGVGVFDSYTYALGSNLNPAVRNDQSRPEFVHKSECGELDIEVMEIQANDIGLEYVAAVQNQTFNMLYDISEITDQTPNVQVIAKVINPTMNAQLVLEAADKAGNRRQFRYFFNSKNYSESREVNLGMIRDDEQKTCKVLEINNVNATPLVVNSIRIANDQRLIIETPITFPYTIPVNSKLTLNVCYLKDESFENVADSIIVEYECKTNTVPIRANLSRPALDGTVQDLGAHRVGDTTCFDIQWLNTGNKPITITGINRPNNDKLIFDDEENLFPVTVQPGETFTFKNVCFIISEAKEYSYIFSTIDDYSLRANSSIRLQGANPNISGIEYDFGKVRVGTQNQVQVSIINSGTWQGIIEIKEQAITNYDNDVNLDLFNSLDQTILSPNQEMTIDLNFNPTTNDPINYNIEGQYDIDWQFHQTLDFIVRGEWTLPEIRVVDIDFDTIVVFTEKEIAEAVLAYSEGSEILTIDNVDVQGADIDGFKFDVRPAQFAQIPTGENISIPMSFVPERVGEFNMYFEITHDAMPNYERAISIVNVRGYAIPADTLEPNLTAVNSTIVACETTPAEFSISNTGNVNFTLLEVRFDTNDDIEVNFDALSYNMPLEIAPDAIYSFSYELLAPRGSNGTINIVASLIDHTGAPFILEQEVSIETIANALSVNSIDTEFFEVGSEIELQLSGSFVQTTELAMDFNLELTADPRLFYLSNNVGELIISKNNEIVNVLEVNLQRIGEKVFANLKNRAIFVEDKSVWTLNVPFIVMLDRSDNISTTFELMAFGEECFERADLSFTVNIADICTFPIRSIQLIKDLPFLNVTPSPVVNNYTVHFNLPEDDDVEITVFSLLGEIVEDSYKKSLGKGEYFVNFENKNLSSGTYVLNLKSRNFTRQKILIITK